jgi:hydrogenase maturation protease
VRHPHPRRGRERSIESQGSLDLATDDRRLEAVLPTTYVLSLGNVLMSDDGVGPAVLRSFEEQYVVGPSVTLVDLGTPGLDLSPWFADADRVILIDSIKADLPPGSVRLYKKSDLLNQPPGVRVSPHDPGVKETLLALEFAGRAPRDVELIGIVPAVTTMGIELTPPVAAAVPTAVLAILGSLERAGAAFGPRPSRLAGEPWHSVRSAIPLPEVRQLAEKH